MSFETGKYVFSWQQLNRSITNWGWLSEACSHIAQSEVVVSETEISPARISMSAPTHPCFGARSKVSFSRHGAPALRAKLGPSYPHRYIRGRGVAADIGLHFKFDSLCWKKIYGTLHNQPKRAIQGTCDLRLDTLITFLTIENNNINIYIVTLK